jgi:hypothetical protein
LINAKSHCILKPRGATLRPAGRDVEGISFERYLVIKIDRPTTNRFFATGARYLLAGVFLLHNSKISLFPSIGYRSSSRHLHCMWF